ncbi:MAG TPA: hypothetical protein VFW08_09225 [bacterium]|nr:hypothetical protein [bacterium]
MGGGPVQIHEGEFVRVRVPDRLERSLQLALAEAHAPFFHHHEAGALEVVLREAEWARIAPRFAGAQMMPGFRLVSVHSGGESAFPARLRRALADDGVDAALLPSFHNDHVLVRADQLERCLAVVRKLLSA